jgi:hypothetical protein
MATRQADTRASPKHLHADLQLKLLLLLYHSGVSTRCCCCCCYRCRKGLLPKRQPSSASPDCAGTVAANSCSVLLLVPASASAALL